MKNHICLYLLLWLTGASTLYAQHSELDSLRHYQDAYNGRIQELMEAELGETLKAIAQMSVQDTAVFNADSLQRVIEQGQRIIEKDPQAQFFDRKYKYFLARVKGKKSE